MLELAGLAVTAFAPDIKDVHYKSLSQTMAPDSAASLLFPFGTEIDPPLLYFNKGESRKFLKGRIIGGDADLFHLGKSLPLLLGRDPHGLQDLLRLFR